MPEIELLGWFCAGFCTADVNMDRLPGWEPQSYGYHGDDGNVFRSDGKGRRFGPLFGTGARAALACSGLTLCSAYFTVSHQPMTSGGFPLLFYCMKPAKASRSADVAQVMSLEHF